MYMCPYIQHVWNSCSGNPAAVCLLEEDVPDQLKQAHYQTVIVWSFWILKLWWWWRQKKWRALLTGVSYWDEYFWNMLPHSSSWGNQRSNVTSVHLQCVFQYFSLCWTFRPILHLVSIFLFPRILWLWAWRLSSPGFEGESHFGLRWFTPTNEVSNIANKKRDKPRRKLCRCLTLSNPCFTCHMKHL